MPPTIRPYTQASIVTIGRSDGRQYTDDDVKKQQGSRETKISEALDPDIVFDAKYEPTKFKDAVSRWRQALGKMLADEFGWPKDKQYILRFPEHYDLRALTYSDRMEYHVYGHPSGVQAQYRSPPDFFPHVVWLLSDSQTDADCLCTPCQKKNKGDKHVVVKHSKLAKQEKKVAKAEAVQAKPSKAVDDVVRPSITTSTTASSFYRAGEIVWFIGANGASWRIGVLTGHEGAWSALPFSYPNSTERATPVKLGAGLRPFLTYNVPQIANLPELNGRNFDTVDWRVLLAKHPEQTIATEASKMASLFAEGRYSTFGPLSEKNAPVKSYTGVFLGGECIQVGDAIRHAGFNNNSLLPHALAGVIQVTQIMVNTPPGSAFNQGILSVQGVLWTLKPYPLTQPVPAQLTASQPQGLYFTKEARFRNSLSERNGFRWLWVRDASQQQPIGMGVNDIAGRVYVTSELLSATLPDKLQAMMAEGLRDEEASVERVGLTNRAQHERTVMFGRMKSRAATVDGALGQKLLLQGVDEGEHR